jgi:hypothetical protein
VAAEEGDRLVAGFLPGLDVHVGDAAADLAQVGAGVGGLRPAGPQVLDGDVDGLVHLAEPG